MGTITSSRSFEIIASTLPAWPDVAVPVAASRAGAVGVLNLEETHDVAAARTAIERLIRYGRGALGVKIGLDHAGAFELLSDLPRAITILLLTAGDGETLPRAMSVVRQRQGRVLVECTDSEGARLAVECGADGLVAKGHEAGGHVGEETTFILVQRLLTETDKPVWAYGGIGLHSAAACYTAGCAGILIDVQLALTRESKISPALAQVLERFDGDETLCLGNDLGERYRLYRRPGLAGVEALQRLEVALTNHPDNERQARWRDEIRRRVGFTRPDVEIWPLGQDAGQAVWLSREFRSVAGVIAAFESACAEHVALAREQRALDRRGSLARAHRTDFPILQGPMTRVSDTPGFAEAVAANGALPFLALALLRGPQVRELLQQTQARMGDRPWGVGILGFVPLELRQEQLDVIESVRPPFAIIAGGRPDQAARLQAHGIETFLHVPAPGLLKVFIEDGARRFIFEGRECGGHVGPRTSFVLWESMIDTLLAAINAGTPAAELHIVFAGGIHDARSAAMVATMAAPLVARGVHIGVLLGTAYLFTEEAVASNAIVENFQKEAVECSTTVLLESGPGHSTRCVATPFHDTFRNTKRRLVGEGRSADEIRAELENLNLGRLRIASKGIARQTGVDPEAPRYVTVDRERQHVDGMYMIGQLAGLRRSVCRMSDLHHDVSVGGARLLEQLPSPMARPRPDAWPAARPCDIAIIGMGGLFPKAADVQTFWANVLNKVDAITEVPKDRFDIDLYYHPDRSERDKVNSRWGGFLDEVPFDPVTYGIPPAALPSIDSLQLLSLEAARQALADAGYLDSRVPRDRWSVILGLSGGLGDLGLQYGIRSNLPAVLDPGTELLDRFPEWTEDSFPGILLNVAAGRIANRFDFGGVNYTVDAACASSLASIYLAVRELENHTSDLVMVGGVDTVQSPFGFLCFSKAQALSPRGRCRTFDASADGIAISEGVAMLVLKRLEDAERDGDRIYAVIKGIGGSSDGRGRSLTAPRPEGQTLALERAYAQAGISPSSVGLIEAHGTGTVAGDAAEVAALSQVFQQAGAAPGSCAIGSVKSMIGHTKSAAGATGVMKVALALHHKVLPPTLHVETPNPRLREPASPFFVSTEPRPWISVEDAGPRRAGVSSFGFGGTNFHAVLEEYNGDCSDRLRTTSSAWPAELFVWQGSSAADVEKSLRTMAGTLESTTSSLRTLAASVCKASATAAPGARLRVAIVATDRDDLGRKLTKACETLRSGAERLHDPSGVYIRQVPSSAMLAFVFPGQGSQTPNMLRDVAVHFPHIRESLDAADAIANGALPRPLSSYIFPAPAFTPEERTAQMQAITDTSVAQPALGAIELGLYSLLRDLGLAPDMVAGHSYGEYVALAAAGVVSSRELLEISIARGRVIAESVKDAPGTMAAVAASADRVSAALGQRADVWVANLNAPGQTIISGTVAGIEAGTRALEQSGLRASRIPVSCAFHSPLMESAREKFAAALDALDVKAPSTAVFSNTSGEAHPSDPSAIRSLLASHLVTPVKFVDEIRAMYNAGARTFVEVGPKNVLSGLLRQILDAGDVDIVSIDQADRHGMVQLLHALGQCAVAGHMPRLSALFDAREDEAAFARKRPAAEATWFVSGAGARPAHKPRTSAPRLTVASKTPVAEPVAPHVPVVAPPAPLPHHAPAGASAVAGTSDAVMQQFQTMMSQFLQTQTAVITAYLQGGGVPGSGAPGSGVPVPVPVQVPVQVQVPVPVQSSGVPVPVPVQVPHVPVREVPVARTPAERGTGTRTLAISRDVLADLLRLVSERTGYPAEMLDPVLNIEADLGIDSIKRVEILSAFQRSCSPGEQSAIQHLMDRLTSLKTLREIAAAIGGALVPAADATAPATAVTAPAPAAERRDVMTELVELVSERTGYPKEMLDPDLNIEADLGIDSIKRVEILSTFQRRGSADEQRRVHEAMETLTSRKTLRELARSLSDALVQSEGHAVAPGMPEASSTAPEQESADEADAPRFVMQAVDTPITEPARLFPGRLWLITDDEHGVAESVAASLTKAGEPSVLLRHGGTVSRIDSHAYTVDLADAAQVAQVLVEIQRTRGVPGGLLHLLPLKPATAWDQMSTGEWRERMTADVKTLYTLVRAMSSDLVAAGPQKGAMLVAATGMGSALTGGDADFPPSHGGIAGFLKTAAIELSSVTCRAVHLDASDIPARAIDHILSEIGCHDASIECAYGRQRRVTFLPQLAPAASNSTTTGLGPESVFLITGGARGITAEIAAAIARAVRPRIFIVGRSPRPVPEASLTAGVESTQQLRQALTKAMRAADGNVKPSDIEAAVQRVLRDREIRRALTAAERAGAAVEYIEVDVRDETAFAAVIDRIYADHGRLDVVVHGAGIIEDKLLKDKTPESFDRVVGTKTDSAFTLMRQLRPASLKVLIFMSSVTATFGNRGQADYGAANGVLNAAAAILARRWPGRVRAINWGPWDKAGMVSDEVKRQFATRGIRVIPIAAGTAVALREILAGEGRDPIVVVGDGPWRSETARTARTHEVELTA